MHTTGRPLLHNSWECDAGDSGRVGQHQKAQGKASLPCQSTFAPVSGGSNCKLGAPFYKVCRFPAGGTPGPRGEPFLHNSNMQIDISKLTDEDKKVIGAKAQRAWEQTTTGNFLCNIALVNTVLEECALLTDPYRELKAARAAGKVIQGKHNSEWVDFDSEPEWSDPVGYYRIKPWELPAPPEGEQWHRTDWTQDDLPDGWRPLLLHEFRGVGDDKQWKGGWITLSAGNDLNCDSGPATSGWSKHRTTRPLPVKPAMVPLGPQDIVPGTAVRKIGAAWWILVTGVNQDYLEYLEEEGEVTWTWEEARNALEYLTPGQTQWRRCEKIGGAP